MRLPLITLITVVVITTLAPVLTGADPMHTDTGIALQAPSLQHWLGTDAFGRDVWSRTLYGGRHTLLLAGLATLAAAVPGTLLGLSFGWRRTRTADAFLNAWLAFPGLLMGFVLLTLLGQGVAPLILATSIAQIAPFAVVTRAAVLVVQPQEYITAAQAAGANSRHILRYHVLPNIRPTLLVYMGVVFGYCILNSAALSFLGLGGEPGIPDWGVMLAEGREALRAAPWIAFAPGIAITLTVMAVNRLADALNARF